MSAAWEPLVSVLRRPPPALPLHLPAHGRGRALASPLRRLLRLPPGRWDLPELPELGGPLDEEGAVAESQQRCAALFGARRCWFGVNGASGLLQVALLSLCPPGSRVLLPRNLHRSLLHACVLGDLVPVLFDLPFDPLTGLQLPPTPAHFERVLDAAAGEGSLAAVALVDPSYHGFAADLGALVDLAHAADLPVLVDQAHGRGEAVAAGADLVVLSLQKAASGLAQSAALLAVGERVDPAAVERALLWLQTSSPSALLLASAAAALGALKSASNLRRRARAEARAGRLRRRLEAEGFLLLDGQDPLRLVLATAPMGLHGPEADRWLMERGVVAELPEPGALTFCLGLDPPADLGRSLTRHLLALRQALGGEPLPRFSPPPLPLVATPEVPIGRAWRCASESVGLASARGRIAAEPVCPYPPGIPLLVPGERIDAARAEWLALEQRRWQGKIADRLRVLAG